MKNKKQLLAVILTLAVIFTALFPSNLVFAQENNVVSGENDVLSYELTTNLNNEKTEATVTLKIQPKEQVEIKEVLLPDGTATPYEDKEISYVATENGDNEFKATYSRQDTTEPVEESGSEATVPEVFDVEVPFAVSGIDVQADTEKSEAEPALATVEAVPEEQSAEGKANTTVTTFEELKTAIANASDGDVITIAGTIEVEEQIVIDKSLTLSGGILLKTESIFNSMISIESEEAQKVILSNIILDGNEIDSGMASSLISFNRISDATLAIQGNTVLKNNVSYAAGAISSDNVNSANNVKVIIYDGTQFINNSNMGGNGGVIGTFSGNVIMYGGNMEGNYASTGGGAILVSNHTRLYLYGGTITNNSAERFGGGIVVLGSNGEVHISGNANVMGNTVKGNNNNLFVVVSGERKIVLSNSFSGQIGVSGSTTDIFNSVGITNGGNNPSFEMTESKNGLVANFISDDKNYITRIIPDGANNKVILGKPIITYHLRGGNFTDATEEEFYTASNQPVTQPADPFFQDHDFIGWYSTSDTSDTGTLFDFSQPITKDTDIYARWYPEVYSIYFDGNGGYGSMNDIEFSGVKDIELPENTFTRKGYTFTGWNTQADGSGIAIADKDTYTTATKNITLYAQWDMITHNVTFDSKGGSAVSPISDIPDDTAITAPTEPSKLGYTFDGWYADEQYKTAWNFDTDKVTSDITLYAKWKENTHAVKYDTGFADVVIADKKDVKWNDANLLPTLPKKEGYGFVGWFIDDKQVTATDKFSDLTTDQTNGSYVTFVAHWTELTDYSVLYNTNGGSMPENTPSTVTGLKYKDVIPTPVPVREGYTFKGWKYQDVIVQDNTGYNILAKDDTLKQIELTAQWEITEHSATPQQPDKPDTAMKKSSNSPKTGDTMNTGGYVLLLGASSAVLLLFLLKKRKQGQR